MDHTTIINKILGLNKIELTFVLVAPDPRPSDLCPHLLAPRPPLPYYDVPILLAVVVASGPSRDLRVVIRVDGPSCLEPSSYVVFPYCFPS